MNKADQKEPLVEKVEGRLWAVLVVEAPSASPSTSGYGRPVPRSRRSEGTVAASLFTGIAGVLLAGWGLYFLLSALAPPLCRGPGGDCDVAFWVASGLVQVTLGFPLILMAVTLWLRSRFHVAIGAAILAVCVVGLVLSSGPSPFVVAFEFIPGMLGGLSAVLWARASSDARPTSHPN